MRKIYLFIIAAMFAIQSVLAVPAVPWAVDYQLPDNSEITINLKGDEYVHWAVSTDGYTMLFNKNGYLEYAVQEKSGNLKLSGVRAHNEAERKADEKSFLTKQSKGLQYSSSQMEAMSKLRKMRDELVADKPKRAHIGTKHIPLILVEFQDKNFTKTANDFELLMNQLNNTSGGITGSLRDYYLANSYGQCDVIVDVFGPYKMSDSIKYYDNKNIGIGEPRNMAKQAVQAASADGCDFSVYAIDSVVPSFHMIFAGYGQEAGGGIGRSIWSHASTMPTIILNGVKLSRYSCSPELRNTVGSNISHIGVIAHELGHAMFDLPDFYNTSDDGAVDLDNWDLMAGGSWNDNGRTPPYFSAYGRDFCGWSPAILLTCSDDITIPHPDSVGGGSIYRINTTTEDEYFLLENRQQIGWDEHIPGSGLMIYHVDKNFSGWDRNTVISKTRRGYYVEQAGCSNDSAGCRGRRYNDPFPRTGKTEFTDASIPSAKSYSGENTGKPITDIVQNSDKSIFFKFKGGTDAPPSWSVELSPNNNYTFPTVGYGNTAMVRNIIVSNTGNQDVDITISLSGANTEIFMIETGTMQIACGQDSSFGISVKDSLEIGIYTATLTVSVNNGISQNLNLTIEVGKGSGSIVTAPTLARKTHNSIIVNSSMIRDSTKGQNIEYGIGTSISVSVVVEWQSDTVFNNLTPNTRYYVFARSIENEKYRTGSSSRSAAITTDDNAAIDDLLQSGQNTLQAWIDNDILHVKGLEVGKAWYIYNISGNLIYIGIARNTENTQSMESLPSGVYIIKSENKRVKIINL